MKLKSHKGFTLIELLVVVAIIGILASVVLAALGSARGKAVSAKIQGQLSQMRAQAEIYYSTFSTYGSASDCTGGMFAISSTGDGLKELRDAVNKDNNGGNSNLQYMKCSASTGAWAVAAFLGSSGSGGIWCVDSNGASIKTIQTTLSSSISADKCVP